MRFRWFVKKSDFDTELNSGRIGIGDICFILDRLRIYTRSSSFDFSNRPIYQGETSTSDSTGTWTVSIDGITELYDGLTIKVKITTGQGSSYSTLNVNNLGANPIWFGYGVPLTSSTPLTDNQEVILTYRTTASASGITIGGTSYTRGWVMSESLKTTVGTGLKITNGALGLDYGNVSTGNTTKPVTGSSVYDAVPHTYIKTASVSGTTLTLTTQNNSTVDFTDTTYESKSAASGGTDVSLVTTGEKYTWNNKGTYSKPSGGIPKTDLDSSVQTSLGLADTAVQDISGKADKSATVSTVSYDSTNKKLTKTINGTTSDIVTVSTLKTDMSLSKSDVGLGNVTNDAQVKRSEMGVASGVATLDSGGKVPSSQLPSYVDDVIEGYYYNGAFYKEAAHTTEITGETGKIYVDLSTEKTYRWSGSSYVEISSSDVTGIKVGSTGSTITPSGGIITIPAYETGAQVNTITGVKGNSESSYRTGNVNITKSDIGLSNVGNFKAVSTEASQGLSDTEKSNARTNIGAGTSSFSGSYNDLTNKPTIPDAANDGTFSIKTKVGTGAAVTAADFTANQSSADDITFIQGDNITLTTDTTNRTISISATDTTYVFDGTYNASTNKAATVSTVTNAINALDGGTIGTGGTGKTITSLSQTNGNVSATFSDISITKSQISDFPTIPAAVAVKGDAETSYRTGNVNLTPANLGAVATSDITSTYSSTGTAPVNGKAVAAALATLPEPMVFKGSLGTGGTITSLPVDGTANVGDTYKVITAGTYDSKAAKVGDTFICLTKTSNSNTWELIPSGDEPSGTVTSVTISNGGGLSVSGSPITSSGTITVSHADTSSQASVNNSGRTYIQGITLDTYGHVTGISSATETVVNTDRYVNSASFEDNSTNASSPIKMTLTRAGSDTSTITANIPKVSSSSAGVVPKGTAVSSQSQLTKFLREDGTWATPSYTVDTNTASAVDNIFKGSNNATAITYAPYTSQQNKLSFDTSIYDPVRTDRLNLNGYLHATKLYSGGTEVVTDISGKADKATTLAGYGITDAHITSGVITLGSGSVDTKTFVTLSTNQTVSGQKTFSNSIIGDLTGNATTATTAQNLVSKGTSDYFYMADGSISNGYDLIQTMVDEWSADHGGTLASYQCSSTVYDDIFTS